MHHDIKASSGQLDRQQQPGDDGETSGIFGDKGIAGAGGINDPRGKPQYPGDEGEAGGLRSIMVTKPAMRA